ncbi:MAG: 2-C-methyl-D-erythritol 4-phosphate cytidylyltransferase [Lachnospiraceae bacterium]|nr:2-C-methyl-D-erythritol 4-phosphate cytidylyltransferase [Lachnospiraceae bacterium]
MKCIAVILSGGTGNRMNMDIPKQYIEVNDRMIITESIRPFMECALVSGIRIVADEMWHDKIMDEYRVLSEYYMGGLDVSDCSMDDRDFTGAYKLHGFSKPGDNRQLSILNALRDITDAQEDILVIIHDAARPLASVGLITRCIEACYGHDGVMPVLPMKDTVYYSEDGRGISELLNRDRVFAGQAPEVFRLSQYLKACEALLPDKIMEIRGSTEPAVMVGLDVVMIPGEEENFKITTREDLEHYKELLK